jgi:predicted heme/steroid binding protein
MECNDFVMEGIMNISDLITKYESDICYFQQMQIYSMTTYEKNYYSEQIQQRTNALIGELEGIMELEVKNLYYCPEGNNYGIRHLQEEKEPIEEYPYNVGNKFIIPEPNTENLFHLSVEQESEDGFTISPENNREINSEYNTEELPEKEFTLEELAEYNGINGKPPYVAINGIVYDMSHIRPWASGTHFGLSAGNNLTEQFMGCHRGAQSVLNKLIQVGRLVE